MATRDEVLRLLIQIEGAGELDRLIAELKQVAAEALPAQVEVLPMVSRQALMGRGGAAPRYALSEHLRMRRHMVCHFIAPSPELSPEQWAALCAERERVGRALCDREARAVLVATATHRHDQVHARVHRRLSELEAEFSSAEASDAAP